MPSTPFRVNKGELNILEVPTQGLISAGISVGTLVAGVVPMYEEHEARFQAGYTIPEWEQIGPTTRAFEVAHYRLRKAVEAHHEEAKAKAAKKKR